MKITRFLVVPMFVCSLQAQHIVWERLEPPSATTRGWQLAGGGDFDRDGFHDVVVGAEDDATNGVNAGAVRIYSGVDGTELAAWFGDGPGDRFGSSVDVVGDLDGDGHPDIVVGAPGASVLGVRSGKAQVFSGATRAVLHTFRSDRFSDEVGAAVRGAGDVDADGHPDVVVGAPGNGGAVRVYSGRDGSVLHEHVAPLGVARFGSAVAAAGDTNGDGFDDVLIGLGIINDKRVRLMSGRDGAMLFEITLGYTELAGIGDVNRNGSDDFAIASPDEDAGVVRVFDGRSLVELFRSVPSFRPLHGFGFSIAPVDDGNGDGVPDIAVGSRGTPGSTGALYVSMVSGSDGSAIWEGFMSYVGRCGVCSVGDLDGDGLSELAVVGTSAFRQTTLSVRSAASWAQRRITGRPPTVDTLHIIGDTDGDGFAESIEIVGGFFGDVIVRSGSDGSIRYQWTGDALREAVPVGDFNGDGIPDFGYTKVHGQHLFTIYSGRNGAPLYSAINQGWNGVAVGDVNGDGRDDFAIGPYDVAPRDTTRVFTAQSVTPYLAVPGDYPIGPAGDMNADGYGDFYTDARVVRSGADGSVLFDFVGYYLIRAVWDVNGDGFDDMLANRAPQQTCVLSGADGTELFAITTIPGRYVFSSNSFGPGDIDGDGFAEFAFPAESTYFAHRDTSGTINVYSGRDASVLMTLGMSTTHPLLGDVNGDGTLDVAGEDRMGPSIHSLGALLRGATLHEIGTACPHADGRRPHATVRGLPRNGTEVVAKLRGSAAGAPAALIIGSPAPHAIPLDVLGAFGCNAYFGLDVGVVGVGLDPLGAAALAWTIGWDPSSVGGRIQLQWVILDPLANPAGWVTSNAVTAVIGG